MKLSTLWTALVGLALAMLGAISVSGWISSLDNVDRDQVLSPVVSKPTSHGLLLKPTSPPGTGCTPLFVEKHGLQLRIIHLMGEVRFERVPLRICSLAFTDELLAIGVQPIAAGSVNGKFPDYLTKHLHGVTAINQLMGAAQPSFEALIAVQPDLIIMPAGDPQTYYQLSKIAPVVVLGDDGDNNRQRVLDLGTLLDRREYAEQQIASFDARIARAKQVLQSEIGDSKVAFFRIFGKQFYIHGHTRGGLMLYDELGLSVPTLIADSPKGYMLSPESLLQLDADYVFVAAEDNQGAQRSWSQLLSHPAWQRVPAIQAGHVYPLVDQHHWLRPGFLAKLQMLDDIVRALIPGHEVVSDYGQIHNQEIDNQHIASDAIQGGK